MGKLRITSIIIVFMIFIISSAFVHEYYVSITNININETANQLEIELKLDAEDFEKILTQEHGVKVNFDVIDEKEIGYISDYVSGHLTFFVNGGSRKLKLIGEELNPDGDFWCYFLVDLPEVTQSIKVKNEILLPTFLQQHNIVNLKAKGKIQSHTFIAKHITHTFKIDAN